MLLEVTVRCELLPQLEALRQLQFRWAKGTSQVARKLLPALCRGVLPLPATIIGSFRLLNYVVYTLLLVLVLLQLPIILTERALAPAVLLTGLATLCHLPLRLVRWTGLSVIIIRGVFVGLLGRPSHGPRTPKVGVCTANVSWSSIPYAFGLEHVVWAEAFVALYAFVSCGIWHCSKRGAYAVAVWLGCYSASCGLVARVMLWQAHPIQRGAASTQMPQLASEMSG